ncbi:glycosyltransferase [Candidatus Pinguicoccus supinus]|uniref:Glycosyltransferase n=1 Tax=Candidatus Pinguicoccus supinus TaxID=2529394 RepID=A0A7T0BRT5_9BACT|nr:glycosyltransferase [Candidatus Pinguicoccus supinus]
MLNSIVCLKKCYIYLTLHGSEIIYLSSVIWKRFFLKILNNAKLIFVNSVFTKKILKFSGSLSISNNIVLLKPSKFLNFNEKIPLKFSISKLSNINLITVGRIHFRKGHVFTLNIVKNLSNYCTKLFIYNIVGPNIKNKYNYFLLKISNLINTQVVFKQNISLKGLNKEYLVSDVFVMLSLIYKNSVEGFGLVYSEAGLQKIPVIASLIGGTNDAVINKYTGFIFYKKEIHKFFKSILLLHKNTNSKLSLGF